MDPDPAEAAWYADPQTIMAMCSRCGEWKPCQLHVDPFENEGIIERGRRLEWWCFRCLDVRRGDV